MGGCASKPKVLKVAKMEAAAPHVEEKVSKGEYGGEKDVEKVVVEVTKEIEAGEEKQPPKSLGNLFKESEEVEECELAKKEEQIPSEAAKEIHEVMDSSETKDKETALDAKITGEKREFTSEKPEVVAAPSEPKSELLTESKAEEAGESTEVVASEPPKTEGPGTIVVEEERTTSSEREKAESNTEPKQEFVVLNEVEKLEVPIKNDGQGEVSVTLPCEEEPKDKSVAQAEVKIAPNEVEVVKEVEKPQDHPVVAKEQEEVASKEVTESEKKEEVPLNEKYLAAV